MLRGVVIGAGYFSRIQMADWLRLRDLTEITAVCDADPVRAQAFAQEFGIARTYSGAAQMLDAEHPDFVDIVTRPDTHLPLCQLAFARKIPVLCQKPFAPTLAEAQQIVDAAEAAQVRIMVNENWRWQAWYRELKRRIDAGEIGAVQNVVWAHSNNDGLLDPPYPNQPYFAQYPRLLIYETLVHFLDTATYLFGRPEHLRAFTKRVNPRIAGEDSAQIRLFWPSGLRCWITATRCGEVFENNVAMARLRIDGERGSFSMLGDGSLWQGNGNLTRLPFEPPTAGYKGDSALATQRHFLTCLLSGQPFETNGRDYLFTVSMVEASYESAATRATVAL
ncbi:MAG: Gfo/Idh/MocA family oxidoreductase [Bryobacteraceae bacterium]|nr:Gfo/Idh/MocA family oxidoreductase [Bryobacteraceae bacterium]